MNAVILITGQYIGIEIATVLVKFAVILAFLAMLYSFFGNYLVARFVLSLYHKKGGEQMLNVETVFSGNMFYVNDAKVHGDKFYREWYRIPIFMGMKGACSKAAQIYRRYQVSHGAELVRLSDLGELDEDVRKRLQHMVIDKDLDELTTDALIFMFRAERINRRDWLWRIFN
jgi:hypothetical protein